MARKFLDGYDIKTNLQCNDNDDEDVIFWTILVYVMICIDKMTCLDKLQSPMKMACVQNRWNHNKEALLM